MAAHKKLDQAEMEQGEMEQAEMELDQMLETAQAEIYEMSDAELKKLGEALGFAK